MTNHDATVTIRDVSRTFGRTQAVKQVSLTVKQGALFGILGPDGAGKTTLLRMTAGVLNPTDPTQTGLRGRVENLIHPPTGHITVGGYDTVTEAEAVKAHISYMPQNFGLYGDLSVVENLTFAADVFGVTGAERQTRFHDLLDFAGLNEFQDRLADRLSGGMKKKLALACALLHRPDVLLLDEPTTGVDPVARRDFWDLLSGLHSQGITTIVTTPYMDEAERCSEVALLFEGEVLASGTPDSVKGQIPGRVLSVRGVDIRQAESVLREMDGFIDIQTYGDQLNLLVAGDFETQQKRVVDRLKSAGVGEPGFVTMPIRMEEAFIYLVRQAREGGTSS